MLAVAGITTLAPGRCAAAARLGTSDRNYDAGTVEQGTTLRHAFILRNAGDTELTVDAVPSCSCTVAAFDELIPPGGTGTIVATVDTTRERGSISKDVRVTTNDPAAGSVLLHVWADVIPAFRVSPTDHPVISGTPRNLRPVEVVVASMDGTPFEVRGVAADPALSAELARTGDGRYTVTIAAKPDVRVGRSQPFVTLSTSHPRVPSVDIVVNLDVHSNLQIAPARLVLRGASGAEAQHVTIRTAAGATVTITGVASSNPDVVATLATMSAGRVYDVAVRHVGMAAPGVVRANVTIATDDPAERAIVIPVTVRR